MALPWSIDATALLVGIVMPLVAAALGAPQNDSVLANLRSMHVPEASGDVPVLYVPSAKDRALGYQGLEQAVRAWYEEQLDVKVPFTLAVLDRDKYKDPRVGLEWPVPYSITRIEPVIIFPCHIEDLVSDSPSTKMPGEHILYHETGHIVADAMKIASGNNFVNEIVADVFLAAYVHAKRPELTLALGGPPADFRKPLRYTSLVDFDYLGTGVGLENYFWFQASLRRVADFLVKDRDFPDVVTKLQQNFPARAKKQETVDEIVAHLGEVRPGVREILGPLAGPSTLPLIQPSTCRQAAGGGRPSYVAIYNKTGAPLTVTPPNGFSQTLAAQSWSTFPLKVGASIELGEERCVVAIEEPALAIIESR